MEHFAIWALFSDFYRFLAAFSDFSDLMGETARKLGFLQIVHVFLRKNNIFEEFLKDFEEFWGVFYDFPGIWRWTTKQLPSPLSPLPSNYQAPSRVRVLGGDVRRISRLLAAGHSKSWRWCWLFLPFYRCVLYRCVQPVAPARARAADTSGAPPSQGNVQSGCH